jgi:hypothetical protein
VYLVGLRVYCYWYSFPNKGLCLWCAI